MTKISPNYQNEASKSVSDKIAATPVRTATPKTSEISHDEFLRREKRKNNGLIERLYNTIKNTTNLGIGSKKVDIALNKVKNGEITEEEFNKTVHDYHSSQENSAQLLGDGTSMLAGGFTFLSLNKAFKYGNGWVQTNQPIVNKVKEELSKYKAEVEQKIKEGKNNYKIWKKVIGFYEKSFNAVSSNKKLTILATGLAGLAGGITKYWTLKFNRAGSDEYKIDKQIYGKRKERTPEMKKAVKAEKKSLNKERHMTNFKNFVSGTVNGLMMPVLALGGIVGAPLYLIGNSLNRYFIANKTDKKKSVNGYINNLTNDSVTMGLFAAGAAIPLVKKGNYTKVFNENMAKSVSKLKNAQLADPEFGGISAYKKLESKLLGNTKIQSIIDNDALSINEKITQLTEENIFAVKFKQISGDGSELARALKDNCPPTRSIKEAQEYINVNLGSGYQLTKLLGVGTIAETYFAKSPEGTEVCIKILKDGISKEKITADKEKFVEMIKNATDMSADEKDYLIRNIDDLADGVLQEVNLQNEMDNAIKLAKSTKVTNVVEPAVKPGVKPEVKNNVYVMKRATGVSLASFIDLNRLYIEKEAAEKLGGSAKELMLERIEKEIEAVQSRMPGFGDIKLRKEDTDYLLKEYQRVFIEQFHKVDKNGKIIHADIHPGNIFIDPDALRTRKGKVFTLIDTGNMIDMSVEQSLRALNFSKYIKQGNVKDIAAFVLDGAKLPAGMSEKQALELVENELKACFFDNKTKLGILNDEKVLTLTDNIMQKYNIIPNSTQLNLNKSRTSARNSLEDLKNAINSLDMIDVAAEFAQGNKLKGAAKGGLKGLENIAKNKAYESAIKRQEEQNLKQLSKAEQSKQKNNPNVPKTNSEEYITYRLKQFNLNSEIENL